MIIEIPPHEALIVFHSLEKRLAEVKKQNDEFEKTFGFESDRSTERLLKSSIGAVERALYKLTGKDPVRLYT